MQTQVTEIFAAICFPGSFGNSPNMRDFLVLSENYWDINRVGGGDDLSFVLPEKRQLMKVLLFLSEKPLHSL